jgi:hypothetical protein
MVLTIKTLIIFDTNPLRHALRTNRNGNVTDVVYHTFEFGSFFTAIESYIQDKDLTSFVELAIPRIALDEIKRQKLKSYRSDFETFLEIHNLMSKIPYANVENMQAPDRDFSYQTHMEQMAEEYLKGKKIRLIELPDNDHLKEAFQSIVQRALDFKPPFNQNGEQFKDALIWESIISYADIEEFDKITLFTADNGFSGCEQEFQQRFKKYFSIQKTEGDVIEQLEDDYAVLIENQSFAKFARTDYFKSLLEQQLQKKSIVIGPSVFPIVSFDILDQLESMDKIQDDEENEEIVINSRAKIFFIKPDGKSESVLIISTFLDETKTVIDVRFDLELVDQ